MVAVCIFINNRLLFPDAVKEVKSPVIWKTVHLSNNNAEIEAGNSTLTMYRNSPQRNAVFGVSKLTQLTKKWKTQKINFGIHSASKASTISDSKNIYVGSDTSWFYSIDKASGQINWKIYLGESLRGIHSTAALDGDFVYIGSYRGSVYKLNKQNGHLEWMRILGNAVGASPLIDSKYILFNVETTEQNGYLVKMNKFNGEIIWISDFLGEQSHSSPALSIDGKIFVIGVNNSTIQGFDYSTGKRQWITKVQGPIKSTAWIDSEYGYLTGWGNELLKFNIYTGKLIWKVNLNLKSQVSPAVSKKYNTVIAADSKGTVYGVDTNNGKINWQWEKDKFNQISSPILIQTKLDEFFLYSCKVAHLCLISPKKGTIVNSWKLDGQFTGSLLIDQDVLYLSFNNGAVEAFQID